MTEHNEIRFRLDKLRVALPGVIGKTISDIVVTAEPSGRGFLFLVFTDGTHYEFYDFDSLNGARCVDRGGVEHIAPRASAGASCLVVSAPKGQPG